MADVQKPVELPKDAAVAPATEPVAETKPLDTSDAKPVEATETPATTAATDAPADAPAAEAAPVAAEEPKKDTPVEEGHLEHKGLNFPKNFIYSKQLFWFGNDSVEHKNLSSYLKAEKSTEAGHHNAAWASHTGKGLLFFGDKKTPHGVINLADASEPAIDGSNKFHFTSKGHKHTFKTSNAADRDNWVSQLKLKIAEAKELAATVTESEAYKSALDTLKPKPLVVKKEEKAVEAPKEEAAKEETPAAAAVAAAEETPKEEEPKKEERRSASRKRGSIFGSLLGKKDDAKKEEAKKEEKPVEAAPATEPAAETAAPAAEPAVEAAPVTTEAAPATEPAVEDKPAESKAAEVKEAVKPTASKRNSIFGNVFGKKEKKAVEAEAAPASPTKEAEVAPTTDAAPVIPPVETTTPLAAEVASPATVPTETTEATPATNGESKKEVRSEKRKSSLPFAFGKKDKAVVSDEEGEKTEKSSAFSKLRATIKGRGKPSAEKPAAEKAETKTEEAKETKPAEATTSTEATKAADEPEVKPEPVAATTPAVTAAA